MGNRSRMLAAAALVALVPGSPQALPVPAGTHLAWVSPQAPRWTTGVGTIEATGDAVPDVVTVSGDRSQVYQQCLVPPGNPAPNVHSVADRALQPATEITLLDGATGNVLASRDLADAKRPVGQDPETVELVEDVHAGDLDRDGNPDVLVLRSTVAIDGSSSIARTTLYDARTVAPIWDVAEDPVESFAFRRFTPLAIDGAPGGIIASATPLVTVDGATMFITMRGRSEVVRFPERTGPESLLTLPSNFVMPSAVARGDGYRLISMPLLVTVTGRTAAVRVDASATDLTFPSGEPRLTHRWFREGAGGSPAVVSGDTLFVGRERPEVERGSVVAMDLDTGSDRWSVPLDVGPRGGTLTAADIDADGIRDVIASPAFPPSPAPDVLKGHLYATLVALDGTDGSHRWSVDEYAAKFRAFDLSTAEMDGDEELELIATFATQDGFAGCAQPADDPGMIGTFELADGAADCRFTMDRFPGAPPRAVSLDARPGNELVVGTLGGNVYAFTHRGPACGEVLPA